MSGKAESDILLNADKHNFDPTELAYYLLFFATNIMHFQGWNTLLHLMTMGFSFGVPSSNLSNTLKIDSRIYYADVNIYPSTKAFYFYPSCSYVRLCIISLISIAT